MDFKNARVQEKSPEKRALSRMDLLCGLEDKHLKPHFSNRPAEAREFAPETLLAAAQMLPQLRLSIIKKEIEIEKLEGPLVCESERVARLEARLQQLEEELEEARVSEARLYLRRETQSVAADFLLGQARVAASVFSYDLEEVRGKERDLRKLVPQVFSSSEASGALEECSALKLLSSCGCRGLEASLDTSCPPSCAQSCAQSSGKNPVLFGSD